MSFAVADDPFYKAPRSKYYPECIIFNKKGKLLARINPYNTYSQKYGMTYLDNFREAKLKLNDDKKITMNLVTLKKPGRMVLLCVRTFDLRKHPA